MELIIGMSKIQHPRLGRMEPGCKYCCNFVKFCYVFFAGFSEIYSKYLRFCYLCVLCYMDMLGMVRCCGKCHAVTTLVYSIPAHQLTRQCRRRSNMNFPCQKLKNRQISLSIETGHGTCAAFNFHGQNLYI